MRCWLGRYIYRVRAEVLAVYGDVCHICRKPGANSPDHVIPRARWGTDEIGNLRPAHRKCNYRRADRPAPGMGARLIVVCGPPGSDHRGYVHGRAELGDVIVDAAALAEAFTNPGMPTGTVGLSMAIDARAAAVRAAMRIREPVAVWIVHPVPTPVQLADYRAAGARVIVLDRGGGEPVELTPAEADDAARWAADTAPPPPAVAPSARFAPRVQEMTR